MTDAEDRAMLELSYITPCDDAVSGYESVRLLHDPASMTNTQARAALIEVQESRRMMKRLSDWFEEELSRDRRGRGCPSINCVKQRFESEYNAMAAEIGRRVEAGE